MNRIIREDIEHILQYSVPWYNLRNSTVLVSGATSMLGAYMVFALAELQLNHPEYKIRLVLGVRSSHKARKIFGNILSRPDVSLWIADMAEIFHYDGHVDYIIHAAGLASSHFFLTKPVQVALPNVLGTWQLLELARREKVKGFLFFSSGAVYGKLDSKEEVSEEDDGLLLPMDVRSCYAESKRMGENLCADYAAQYGVPAFSVRISHTYGPTLDLKDSRVFCEFVNSIVNDEDIVMKSDGTSQRAFCYLSDATIAFFLILLSGQPGVAYNMCNNDCSCSIGELAQLLCEIFPDKRLRVIEKIREPDDNYSEDKTATNLYVNCSKLYALGWRPQIGLRDGFQRTVASFMDDVIL